MELNRWRPNRWYGHGWALGTRWRFRGARVAIGRYALGEVNEGKAAEIAGLTRWEMRDVLRDAGLELRHGPRTVDGVQENAGLTPGENGSDAE